ncbi:hypothetical protein [Deinococcus altitudinis]|uniref:hypothetical protein n=1 Tax=Deinococcus altitudinis TaxID=468914 RepID=UPI0038917C0D
MNDHPLQATVMDAVPLGKLLLLSVRGLGRRPDLPAEAVVMQTGDRVRLLDMPHSPSMWLLSEVTLLAEPMGVGLSEVHWRAWAGKTLAIDEAQEA